MKLDSESSVKGDVNRKTPVPEWLVKVTSLPGKWEVTRKISLTCTLQVFEAEFDEMPVTAGGGSLGRALLLQR